MVVLVRQVCVHMCLGVGDEKQMIKIVRSGGRVDDYTDESEGEQ